MLGRLVMLVVVSASLACGGAGSRCEERPPATPLDRATLGTITGRVTFAGTPPEMASLRLGADPSCAAAHEGSVPAGDVLVHDGTVENAFVYLAEGLGDRVFPLPAEPVTMDQRGCLYVPHVIGVQTCQEIVFLNSDPVLHNVHGMPEASGSWNFSMSTKGSRRAIRIDAPEVMVSVRCDVHPWMRSYVGVLDHPYFAVTGPDGRFTLSDVPPGQYVVASWHERFGTREAPVTLAPSGTQEVTFTYAGN